MSTYEDELKLEIESLKKKNAELELLLKTPTVIGVEDYSLSIALSIEYKSEIADALDIKWGEYKQPEWAGRSTPLPYIVCHGDEDDPEISIVLTELEAKTLLEHKCKSPDMTPHREAPL